MDKFVRAWSIASGREQRVPERFFDSPLLSRGLTRDDPNPAPTDAPASEPSAYPDGEPSHDWKADELRAYAADHAVDLTGASTKAEFVAAIEAAAPQGVDPDQGAEQQDGDQANTPESLESPSGGEAGATS